LIALLVVGCSKPTNSAPPETTDLPTAPDNHPTLVIDEQHEINGTNTYATYQISASSGIRLDTTQFHFTFGTNAVTPNMIQFIGSNSVYALSNLTETNICLIDANTMETVRGVAFIGFQPGDNLFFAIGRATNSTDFWVSWTGQIEVK
jgi:hypothetical protein